MKVVIADTLTASIGKLQVAEQGAAKQSVFDFQVNPAHPGLQFHRLERTKDRNFWSVRVNQDLRMIVHKAADTAVLCYVAHHDPAYKWAESRKLETHPQTGAAQFVVIDERVETVVRRVVRDVEEDLPVFSKHPEDYLSALGVPAGLMAAVKAVTKAHLDDLITLLPEEAAERLLELADGRAVPIPGAVAVSDPFMHPDAQRRFKVVDSADELRLALSAGWDKWAVFLHPSQRAAVEKTYSGPAKVSGTAGTGKTVVALQRAARLLRSSPKARVLLTTFSTTLASRLEQQMDLLVPKESEERKRLVIVNLHKLARDIWVEINRRNLKIVDDKSLVRHIEQALRSAGDANLSAPFIKAEWSAIVDPLHVDTWDKYKAASRAGRGTPLGAKQKKAIWAVIEKLLASLGAAGLLTWDGVCQEVMSYLKRQSSSKFDHVVADEVQDFGYADLALLRALAPDGKDDLFLCGDPGQRIYKLRTSWAAAGINVRGRSTRLKVNYRTTGQIRRFADGLLTMPLEDGDGEKDARDAVSLLSGLEPELLGFASSDEEIDGVAHWLGTVVNEDGYKPRDIGIFGRTEAIVERAQQALKEAGIPCANLKDEDVLAEASAHVGTMHRAKGLEFKVVVVMGCEQGQLPLPAALGGLEDAADVEAANQQERSLLYVSLTRARERTAISFAGVPSVFLPKTRGKDKPAAVRSK